MPESPPRWFHGGVAGLDAGAVLLPPDRTGSLGLSLYDHRCRRDRVYITTAITEAIIYAGLAAGDVYLVMPRGEVEVEHELSSMVEQAQVVAALRRGVPVQDAYLLMFNEAERWPRG